MAAGKALAPHQLGIGLKGDSQAAAHAVMAALEKDPHAVVVSTASSADGDAVLFLLLMPPLVRIFAAVVFLDRQQSLLGPKRLRRRRLHRGHPRYQLPLLALFLDTASQF